MVSSKLIVVIVAVVLREVCGHGMMLEPPNRSSLWRFDGTSPANYDDTQVFCGGKNVQWEKFGGKCGVCGDTYDAPHPQENENTGKYGLGKVVRTYRSGQTIDTYVDLTTNHLGHFGFSLCVLPDPNKPEPQDCFKDLPFADGTYQYPLLTRDQSNITNSVILPQGLTCDRCVFRWWYIAGNNWGPCGDGTEGMGCGPQETFINCADIAIH